jgi:hypothetical protein
MTTKDIETRAQVPEIPNPEPGIMWIVLTLHEAITEPIVMDLMNNIANNLQQVTHLVNHMDAKVNVNGVVFTHSADILPAMTGDLSPTPQWVETGEPTVNAV